MRAVTAASDQLQQQISHDKSALRWDVYVYDGTLTVNKSMPVLGTLGALTRQLVAENSLIAALQARIVFLQEQNVELASMRGSLDGQLAAITTQLSWLNGTR